MAKTRICYKNAAGEVICYDAVSRLAASSTEQAAAEQPPKPSKSDAGKEVVQAIMDALAAVGDREMHRNPEFISIIYYAE